MSVTITAPSGQQLTMQGVPGSNTPVVESISGIPGSVEMRGETTARLGSGSILTPIYREPREITVKGWMHCTDQSVDVRRAAVQDLAVLISGMWRDGDELGTLRLVHAGMDRTCHVQPDQDGSWTLDASLDYRGWLRWSLDLIAPDPCLYGAPQSALLIQQGIGVGQRFPQFAEEDGGVMSYGAAVAQHATLTNTGNAAGYPTYVIIGNLPSGFTIAQGAGLVRFDGACTADAPVTVDMAGSVTVGGQDRTWLCGEARWAGILPGESINPTFDAPQGTGTCTATISPTWI